MKCNYKIVLFDLDGTLCESGEGILNSAKYAIREMGFPVPPPEVMRKFIGPPMGQSMRNFCGMSQEQAEKAVALYRQRYNRIGWRENRLYPHFCGYGKGNRGAIKGFESFRRKAVDGLLEAKADLGTHRPSV